MPKKIFSNWLGGLTSYSERVGAEGTYAEARDIDPYRNPGFIMPGWKESNKTSSAGGILTGLIKDAISDIGSNNMYALDDTKLYQLTNFGTTFTNNTTFPHTITGASRGEALAIYPIGTTNYLFYFYQTNAGRFDLSSTFDDDWLSTIPIGATTLQNASHPVLEWNSYLWIGNGRYVSKLDGQTGANGTFTEKALDLPQGWEITSLFPTRNYIGICAWRKMNAGESYRAQSAIFFWDGTSADYNYQIPVEDNKITTSFNDDGRIYLITTGRGFGCTLRRLTEEGDEPLKQLKTYVDGELKYFYVNYRNAIDIFQNRLLIGATSGLQNYIFAFGRPTMDYPEILTQPYSTSNNPTSSGGIGVIKQLFSNFIFVSAYDDTYYYWMRFATGYSTNALLKERYEDAGQKIRINYVKFYFKPLVSGDSVTVSIDTDYGTSNSLGTISYDSDGGTITSKRFNKLILCHAFRPVIDWSDGGVAFSKIVVDYDFIGDL